MNRPAYDGIACFPDRKYALILAPDMTQRHAGNIVRAANAFTALGYEPVEIIMPRGRDVMRASAQEERGYDREFPRSRTNSIWHVQELIEKIAETFVPERDAFTLYVTGHGGSFPRTNEAGISFPDGKLAASNLAAVVNETLASPSGLVVCDQCHGHRFAEPFLWHAGMTGVTASEGDSWYESFPAMFWQFLVLDRSITKAFANAYKQDLSRIDGRQRPQLLRPA